MGFSTTWLVILPVSLTSIPAGYFLNKMGAMEHPLFVLIAGMSVLAAVLVVPALIMICRGERKDPFLYVLSIFTFSSVIDVVIALENDGVISSFMTFYLLEGEPYLGTSHGTMISYWDGIAHLTMYILILYAQSNGRSYREVGLYWAGSFCHSMIVFMPGNFAGKFDIKWSILLNTPYMIIPFWAGYRFLKMDSQALTNENRPQSSILKRPLDLLFILFLKAAIFLACFRGLTVLGFNSEISQTYLNDYERYLKDDTSYPMIQMLVYMFYFVPYYIAAICGLWTGTTQSWMLDWALIHAGAAAQGQFAHLMAGVHHLTEMKYRIHDDPNVRLLFYLINGALLVVPQLLAIRCLYVSQFSPVQPRSVKQTTQGSSPRKKKQHYKQN